LIALDTSALVAMANGEPEDDIFSKIIAQHEALIGTPTIFETHLVLTSMLSRGAASEFIKGLMARPTFHPVAFSMQMHYIAADAFSGSVAAGDIPQS
jgi:ribonuclease VapC